MALPLENISDILDNASTLQEYRNIRESYNLKDKDIKYLIDREYNKRLDETKGKEKVSRNNGEKLSLIAHLYLLRNPTKKYNLLEIVINDSTVYDILTGTKKDILKYIENDARERLSSYIVEYEDTDMDLESVIKSSMAKYEKDIDEIIQGFNAGGNTSTLIPQFETTYHDELHSIYYIITQSK